MINLETSKIEKKPQPASLKVFQKFVQTKQSIENANFRLPINT